MKAYGRKNPIRHGASKNRKYSRKGNVCPICNNTKVDKTPLRMKMKRLLDEECASYFHGADLCRGRDGSRVQEQKGRAA